MQRICNITHQGAAHGGPVVLRPVRATPCYNDCGHAVVAGRSIPHAGIRSSCPSTWPRSVACVPGSSLHCPCPSRCCPMDDHPCRHCACRRSSRLDWRLAQINRYVIPVWQRRCPCDSWHVARCLREIMVSVKLLYSRKSVCCWFPSGCVDQRGSSVKLRLL